MTVAGLLAAIASDEPAPGAGAAGAVALALGLACARKALHISAKHHPDDAAVELLDTGLAAAGEAALEYGQQDARHFRALIEAMQLPQGDAGETAARTAAIDDAAAAVRSNTERLLTLCDDALSQLDAVARHTRSVVLEMAPAGSRYETASLAGERQMLAGSRCKEVVSQLAVLSFAGGTESGVRDQRTRPSTPHRRRGLVYVARG